MLGEIDNEKLALSVAGEICDRWWNWLSEQHTYVELGEFVIMPNHLHGIIRLDSKNVLDETVQLPLGRIISAFKAKSTVEINKFQNTPGTKLWQDEFHDRIIRNEEERKRIAEYIRLNPIHWSEDSENPNSEM
ncbi:MAG: transposase [bacterium]|nr:transposase [bacterium]